MGLFDMFGGKNNAAKGYRLHVQAASLKKNGKLAESRAKLDEAYAYYEKGYPDEFTIGRQLLGYSILTLQRGDFEKARELMLATSKHKDLDQTDWYDLRVNFAIVQWKLGMLDKAIETIHRASPNMNGTIYQILGMLLIDKARETGDPAEAIKFNEEALDYDDEDAAVLDNMGQLELLLCDQSSDEADKADHRKAAHDYFKKAYAQKPDQITTLYQLAKMAHEDGKVDVARKYLAKLDGLFINAVCPVTRADVDALKSIVG